MEVLPIGPAFEPSQGQPGLMESSRLSQQQFLQVLVAQLRNQNPLEPQADSDFIAQLAQFDQLMSMNSLSESFGRFASVARLSEASNLIGWEIEAHVAGELPLVGIVESVQTDSTGQPVVVVNGTLVPVTTIVAVRPPSGGSDAGA